ncbi:polysialyltransferase family glycosyltransferase, partial [uncultured Amnibacterium sp.]|uniref:polysialyltransferase family glycosyltransferase n=1 Tax=uncultured Amnibacterium sp. TaxID=1631851 RepID=UPI0035CC0594
MSGTTGVFEVSAAYQLMVLVAAIDAGAFPAADRRILLVSVNSAEPETAGRFERDPSLASLLARFDDVRSYNDLIAPLHPKGFRPRSDELPLWERAFRRELGIPDDDQVDLALESIQTPPARSILAVFASASATVYAEGLMSYGPTRDALPNRMWSRIDRVLHLELVPGLEPMLLTEYGIPSEPIDAGAFRAVVAEIGVTRTRAGRKPHALLLGQYLAPLRLLSARAESELYAELVETAARAGHDLVVYKPHPGAPAAYSEALAARAAAVGIRFEVEVDPVPAEVLYETDPPALVLGCFSTGLITATRFWGIPAVCAGTRTVLRSLPLFEDSNRVPLVLVDLLVPNVGADTSPAPPATEDVLLAVGYAMQWRAHAAKRARATEVLRDPRAAARR